MSHVIEFVLLCPLILAIAVTILAVEKRGRKG